MIMQQTILSSEESATCILMIIDGALIIASFVSAYLCMFMWEQSGICKTFIHSMMMMVSIFEAHSFVCCSICWAEGDCFKEKLNRESYGKAGKIYYYIYTYTVYSESERHSKKNWPKLLLDILVHIASVDVSVALSLISLIWVLPASCSFFSLGTAVLPSHWAVEDTYQIQSDLQCVHARVCVYVCVWGFVLTGNFQYFTHYDQHGLAIILFDRFSKRKRRSRVKKTTHHSERVWVFCECVCVLCVQGGGGGGG